LFDCSANGGVFGYNVIFIFKTGCNIYVRGIDNHQDIDIYVATVGVVLTTRKGPVIGILHQYALLNKGT
jgi:hypothetical protein